LSNNMNNLFDLHLQIGSRRARQHIQDTPLWQLKQFTRKKEVADLSSLEKFERSRRLFERKDRLLAIASLSRFAKLDIGREKRKGLPEVVLAEGKLARDVASISQAMVRRTGRAIISRLDGPQVRAVRSVMG